MIMVIKHGLFFIPKHTYQEIYHG